jgi:glycerophosphoryl diester phosphodiesterase
LLGRAKSLGFDGVDVGFYPETLEIINEDFARKVRAAGLEFHIYTVDDPDLARRALTLGVDSITTNRPGGLRRDLAE